MTRITQYKVVETQTVTDEDLEEIINEWVQKGWLFDGIQFAMRESSKRPAMAFLVFTRREHIDSEVDDDTVLDEDTAVDESTTDLQQQQHPEKEP
jgi:hypothetical protein